jgi:chemotaxis methyl-accepting protein methylase
VTPEDRLTGWQDADGVRPLAPQEFERIRQLAHRTFGLDLKAGKEELVASRLRRLVRDGGFRSFHEYYRHIVEEPTGIALESMIDALAITATDISTRALKFAERAVYDADRCQGLPAAWLSRYCERVEAPEPTWRVSARIRCQTTFRRVNLVERYAWPRRFPIIFCRNVMIYFDSDTQTEVVRKLAEWLEPGGYLFVGHAESLTRISHPLEYVRPAVYRKPAEREARWRKMT